MIIIPPVGLPMIWLLYAYLYIVFNVDFILNFILITVVIICGWLAGSLDFVSSFFLFTSNHIFYLHFPMRIDFIQVGYHMILNNPEMGTYLMANYLLIGFCFCMQWQWNHEWTINLDEKSWLKLKIFYIVLLKHWLNIYNFFFNMGINKGKQASTF